MEEKTAVKKKFKKFLLLTWFITASLILAFVGAFVMQYFRYMDYGREFNFELDTLVEIIFDADFIIPFISIFGGLVIIGVVLILVLGVTKKVNEKQSDNQDQNDINLF